MKLLIAAYRGVAIASLFLLIPSCGPRYKMRGLQPLTTINSHFEAIHDDLTMRARVLTVQEALTTFDGRGKKLFTGKNPVHVIQIACKNDSSETVQIDIGDISLKSISKEELFNQLRFSGMLRALTIGLGGGLGLVGLSSLERINLFALTTLNSPLIFWSSAILLGTSLSAGLIAIPALSFKHFIESKYYNKKIKRDINNKLGNELQIINSHVQKDWLLVVKHENFKPLFCIRVTDRNYNYLTSFEVNLLEKNSFIWHATT